MRNKIYKYFLHNNSHQASTQGTLWRKGLLKRKIKEETQRIDNTVITRNSWRLHASYSQLVLLIWIICWQQSFETEKQESIDFVESFIFKDGHRSGSSLICCCSKMICIRRRARRKSRWKSRDRVTIERLAICMTNYELCIRSMVEMIPCKSNVTTLYACFSLVSSFC